jgi:hypothetical protein
MRPLKSRTAWLQRVQERTAAGYVKWVSGEIEPDRWPGLATKLEGLYRTQATKRQRRTARARGAGNAMLIAYHDVKRDVVLWILQVSVGYHPAHNMERTKDAVTKLGRITVPAFGFELVRVDNSWTWRMMVEHRRTWHKRIKESAAHPDRRAAAMLARQAIWSLSRVPGFRGLRKDAFRLRGVLLRVWRRLRVKEELKMLKVGEWPKIRYSRRVKSQ